MLREKNPMSTPKYKTTYMYGSLPGTILQTCRKQFYNELYSSPLNPYLQGPGQTKLLQNTMTEPPMRQFPCTLFCTQEMFNFHPPRVLQCSPHLLEPLAVDKDVLRSLRALPTGAAWGVNPRDPLLKWKYWSLGSI